MSNNTNGGPSFPSAERIGRNEYGEDVYKNYKGMTLRDYFAAHAPEVPQMDIFPPKNWVTVEIIDLGNGMKGPRNIPHQESWAERTARWAVEYADAMIAERAK